MTLKSVEVKKHGFIFEYSYNTYMGIKIVGIVGERCQCSRFLSIPYLYIINRLRQHNLLPDSYVPMCCFCNILACIGFYVPHEWSNTIIQCQEKLEDGSYKLTIGGNVRTTGNYFEIPLRIHDLDLTLTTGRIFNDIGFLFK
ncbi:hypothetical protein LCGC14_1774470 [marine sediment metagenome]|uniref:Uncharacterized protein n=1 Tax=marine sediment metagenome TaxID=412755 RepID=A0A0F9GX80_9ZZZZ